MYFTLKEKTTKSVFLLRLLFAALLSFCATPSALSEPNPRSSAYGVLGLREGQTVSPESLRELFLQRIRTADSVEKRVEVYSAFQTLSNPEIRNQYDKGLGRHLDLNVSPHERETLAKLAEGLSPATASRLRSTGLISAAFVQNMLVFYVVMGSFEAAKCAARGDPAECNAFYRSQQDWSTHVGGAAFVLGAWGGSAALRSLSGGRIPDRIAGYGGLALGFFANELVLEFAKNPRMKEIQRLWATKCKEAEPRTNAGSPPSPQTLTEESKCNESRDAALNTQYQKLFEETLGSSDWYKDKAPLVIGLIGAAAASEASQHLISLGVKKIEELRSKGNAGDLHTSSCPKLWAALVARQSPEFTRGMSGPQLWRHNLAREFGTVALFVAWIQLLDPAANWAWDIATLERELRALNERREFKTEGEFVAHLTELGKKWDLFRRKKLSAVEAVLSAYNLELTSVRKSIEDTNLFYSWLEGGADARDPAWETLKENFPPGSRPSDSRVQSELDRYARLAFCGASPNASIRNPIATGGLSLPFAGEIAATPFRYLNPPNTETCETPATSALPNGTTWRQLLKQASAKEKREATYAQVRVDAEKTLQARIRMYEQRTGENIRTALAGEGRTRGLPQTVINGFREEQQTIERLAAVAARLGPEAVKALASHREQVEKKEESAQQLLRHVSQPAGARQGNNRNFADFFESLGEEERAEWRKAVDFFHSLMLR
jgi:hypothetical protein